MVAPKKPVVVKRSDDLTEAQRILYRTERERLKAAREMAEDEQAHRHTEKGDLQALHKMADEFSKETIKGYTAPAGLIGEMLIYASLWGKVWANYLPRPNAPLLKMLSRKLEGALPGLTKDEQLALPIVTYLAQLDDKGKLAIEDFLGANKPEDAPKERAGLEKTIKDLTTDWLRGEHGYNFNPADGCFYHHSTKQKLDKETFESLKDDPTRGLTSYLERSMKVYLEEKQQKKPAEEGPSSSATPSLKPGA